MFFLNKRIANVPASMFTWEATTAFDGVLTESELQKRFKDEFGTERCADRVFFWHLVSFNASDGRRHRYLVAHAEGSLVELRKKYDRCLPQQVALFAIADKILRGEWNFVAENACVGECCSNAVPADAETSNDGNLLLVALWNKTLFVLVFMNGRLCHWSEEHGYGDSFDEHCQSRVSRFKAFLKTDEFFSNAGVGRVANAAGSACEVQWSEAFVNCKNVSDIDEFFRMGVQDPFWNHLDLDACDSMKSCEKRRWILFASVLFSLVVLLVLPFRISAMWNANREPFNNVAAVELDLPSSDALDRLSWAKGHRDMLRHKRFRGQQAFRSSCGSLDWTLLGTVGGRAALVKLPSGETKTLMLGDVIYSYRVKSIGKNDVVLQCGGKEVRYDVGSKVGSKVVSKISSR